MMNVKKQKAKRIIVGVVAVLLVLGMVIPMVLGAIL